ncbi:BAG family molecular chaperone regulator 4 [Lates japonicus]|uniref:BAG family molecular chaperone regulator 4 n=1 Tax=Lates japonicus TaxID=270547 RepID=A0AAD3NBQ2_LATJO|nr:BAG family molecular chaperone regulator 4 [Lates japonicus]GLD69535.1 BAG family molecular chaperone regulator 4 [Lates japonicus]
MDTPQYPGYPSHYWYPQSHSTGHYANTYPSGSDVQPQYNPQVMPGGYPNGHGVYSPAQNQAVQLSRAVGHPASHTLSTNIIIILVHTVKGLPDILLDRTLTIVKVVMRCLQTPHTPVASLSIPILRRTRGHTLVRMHPHSSNGSRANSLHKTTMEILSVHHIPQHGQGPELVLHHLTNPRTNSTNVPHKSDPNPGQLHPQIPLTESPQK